MREREKFQILELSIKNDQEIKLFPVYVYQINRLKPVFNLWLFYISFVREKSVGVWGGANYKNDALRGA